MADQNLINSARRLYQSKAAASQSMMPYISKKVFGSFEKIINDSNLKFEQNIEKYGIDTGDITPRIAASMGDKGSEFIDNQFNDIQELSKPFASKKKKAEILGRVNQRQNNLAAIKKEQDAYDAKVKKIIAKKGMASEYNTAGRKASYADFSDPNSEWNKNIFVQLEASEERPVGIYTKVGEEIINVNDLQEPVEVAIREQAAMAKILKKVEDYKKNLRPGDTWEGSSFRNNIMAEINTIISTPEVAGSLAFDRFPGDELNGMSFITSMSKETGIDFENLEDIDTRKEQFKLGDLVPAYRGWASKLADDVWAKTKTRPQQPKGGSGREKEEKDLSYIVEALNNRKDFTDPKKDYVKYVYDPDENKYSVRIGKAIELDDKERIKYYDLADFNSLIPGLNYDAPRKVYTIPGADVPASSPTFSVQDVIPKKDQTAADLINKYSN
jgi:hypothetical protein